ncbi:MAG: ABC transporter substrate-binding protein [Chloroflexi bacterium]|nr:ABC transporter substrate-binding protein [Chloroflexota bacterium]
MGLGTGIRLGAATLAALVLIVTGCGKATPTPVSSTTTSVSPTSTLATTTSGAASTAVSGTTSTTSKPTATTATPSTATGAPFGELRVVLSSMAGEVLYPTALTCAGRQDLLSPMFDTLFNLDGSKIAPGVVERWEASPDGLTWTYYIRKGIKFHDGSELTATDVKFSIEDSTRDRFTTVMKDTLARVDVLDTYSIRIVTKFSEPFFQFLSSFYCPNFSLVIPKATYERNGYDAFVGKPVGSGPWRFARRVPGDMIQFEANANYWGQVPAFKSLSTILAPEESTRIAMLRTGAGDMADVSVEGAVSLESAGLRSVGMNPVSIGVELLGAYESKAAGMPISDARVRQALSLAINRNDIIKTLFSGKAIPSAPVWMSEIHEENVDIAYWLDQAAKVYNRYDLSAAKQLLQAAGYASGFSIKLTAFPVGGSVSLPKLAEVVQGYWKAIGVNAEIIPVSDYGTIRPYVNVLQSDRMIGQAMAFRATTRPNTPDFLNAYLHSTKGSQALLGKAFPELDRLLDVARTEINTAKRKATIDQIIKMAADTNVILTVAQVPAMVGLGSEVDDAGFLNSRTAHILQYANRMKHRK